MMVFKSALGHLVVHVYVCVEIMQNVEGNCRYYDKLKESAFCFLDWNQMRLFQPIPGWKAKIVDGKERKLTARDLNVGTHFEAENLDASIQGLVKRFLNSLSLPLIPQEKAKIAYQLLVVSGEIMESSSMLHATHTTSEWNSQVELMCGLFHSLTLP